MAKPDELIGIGEFARRVRLSVKQLRSYDDLGLLAPAYVDPDSGYRYYPRGQARTAITIALLRSLDVPLADVHELLVADEPRSAALLERQRQRIEHERKAAVTARTTAPRTHGRACAVRISVADLGVARGCVPEFDAMPDVLLRGCRLWGREESADVLVRESAIAAIGRGVETPDADVVDIAGRLVLPGLVEAHCHLDKTLWGGPWRPHSAGDTLADRIANDRLRRRELGIPNPDYIAALLERMVAAGTTYVRSHTDVDPEVGLDGVDAVRTAVRRLEGRVDVEQVAFPQHGLLTNPGTAELLEEALRQGVETIGGIDPAGVDRDPVRHLDVLFDLAARYGAGIDVHLHDPGELGAWELELIIERTRDTGLSGMVTVSHAYGFCQMDAAHQDRLIERLAEAGVTLVTAAVYSFPVPPIKRLRAAGVNFACGHDGICDLWGPYGSGDMLERVMHVSYRSTFRRDEDIELALEAATYGGARALRLPAYGLEVGDLADLVVIAARTPAEAIVHRPPRDLVLKAGRPVARDGHLV